MNPLARGMKRAMRLSGRIAPVLIAAKLVACTVKAVRQNQNKKSRDPKVKEREIELVERAPVAEEHMTEVKVLLKMNLRCFLTHVRRSSPVCTPASGWLVPYQCPVLVLVRALLWMPQQQKSSASHMVLANLTLVMVTPATSIIATIPRNRLRQRTQEKLRQDGAEPLPLALINVAVVIAGPPRVTGDGLARVGDYAGRSEEQPSSLNGELQRILALIDAGCCDPRQVLNIGEDASQPDIKRAYRKLAVSVHPDKCPHRRAIEAFQIMQNAYSDLLCPKDDGGGEEEDRGEEFTEQVSKSWDQQQAWFRPAHRGEHNRNTRSAEEHTGAQTGFWRPQAAPQREHMSHDFWASCDESRQSGEAQQQAWWAGNSDGYNPHSAAACAEQPTEQEDLGAGLNFDEFIADFTPVTWASTIFGEENRHVRSAEEHIGAQTGFWRPQAAPQREHMSHDFWASCDESKQSGEAQQQTWWAGNSDGYNPHSAAACAEQPTEQEDLGAGLNFDEFIADFTPVTWASTTFGEEHPPDTIPPNFYF